MKLGIVKNLSGHIIAAHESDRELLKKMRTGVEYQANISMPRNYKFLKKYFALINMCYQNQEVYKSKDHLREDLQIEAGFYIEHPNINGVIVRRAKSISFAKMKESEFDSLFNKVLDVIVTVYFYDKKDIMDNIGSYF